MANTVPCSNPAHGVQSHIAGSVAAAECQRNSASSDRRSAMASMLIPSASTASQYKSGLDPYDGDSPEALLEFRDTLKNAGYRVEFEDDGISIHGFPNEMYLTTGDEGYSTVTFWDENDNELSGGPYEVNSTNLTDEESDPAVIAESMIRFMDGWKAALADEESSHIDGQEFLPLYRGSNHQELYHENDDTPERRAASMQWRLDIGARGYAEYKTDFTGTGELDRVLVHQETGRFIMGEISHSGVNLNPDPAPLDDKTPNDFADRKAYLDHVEARFTLLWNELTSL